MFIINQQRCYRLTLHFTWCIIFLAFIWHGVYYYGITGTLYIIRWRFPKRTLFCYIIVCIGFHGYFKKIHFFKKKHILPRCNFCCFFSIKSWHCVFLWFWCCSSSDILAHVQNNFESVPQACLGNENSRKVCVILKIRTSTSTVVFSLTTVGPRVAGKNCLYTRAIVTLEFITTAPSYKKKYLVKA